MKTTLAAILLASCALQPSPQALQKQPSTNVPSVVLGTFDSRVLAIAYYRSEEFKLIQHAQMGRYEAGSAEDRQRIDQEMRELQQHVHRQGFGAAPIPELLAMIEDEIPEIARRHGVQAVVSKWDLIWHEKSCETVDLSLALAELFAPDETTRRMLPEILDQAPVPIDELERHSDDH